MHRYTKYALLFEIRLGLRINQDKMIKNTPRINGPYKSVMI